MAQLRHRCLGGEDGEGGDGTHPEAGTVKPVKPVKPWGWWWSRWPTAIGWARVGTYQGGIGLAEHIHRLIHSFNYILNSSVRTILLFKLINLHVLPRLCCISISWFVVSNHVFQVAEHADCAAQRLRGVGGADCVQGWCVINDGQWWAMAVKDG